MEVARGVFAQEGRLSVTDMEAPLTDEQYVYIRELVLDRSSVALDEAKHYLIDSRLQGMTREHGFSSMSDMAMDLMSHGDSPLHREVVERLLTGETSWFRDHHPFELLREEVIPKLMAARAQLRTLTIWCGACSTGQEPYSIAMLLQEHFPALSSWRVRIIATDLSEKMLERTRRAEYSQLEINRGLPAPLLVKYFEQDGRNWKLKESVRDMVEVKPLNLVGRWDALPDSVDVIFLRNVLIYFEIPIKKKILASVRKHLAQDGCLFLGGAETTFNIDEDFERPPNVSGSWYQLRDPAAEPVRSNLEWAR